MSETKTITIEVWNPKDSDIPELYYDQPHIFKVKKELTDKEILCKYLDFVNYVDYSKESIKDIDENSFFDQVLWSNIYYDIQEIKEIPELL